MKMSLLFHQSRTACSAGTADGRGSAMGEAVLQSCYVKRQIRSIFYLGHYFKLLLRENQLSENKMQTLRSNNVKTAFHLLQAR